MPRPSKEGCRRGKKRDTPSKVKINEGRDLGILRKGGKVPNPFGTYNCVLHVG
jgi:hypothetical protein